MQNLFFLDRWFRATVSTYAFLSNVLFSDPGRDKVVAPIVKYKNTKELAQPSAVLLSMDEVEGFFSRYACIISFSFWYMLQAWLCMLILISHTFGLIIIHSSIMILKLVPELYYVLCIPLKKRKKKTVCYTVEIWLT